MLSFCSVGNDDEGGCLCLQTLYNQISRGKKNHTHTGEYEIVIIFRKEIISKKWDIIGTAALGSDEIENDTFPVHKGIGFSSRDASSVDHEKIVL